MGWRSTARAFSGSCCSLHRRDSRSTCAPRASTRTRPSRPSASTSTRISGCSRRVGLAKSKTLTGIAASPGFGVARALVLQSPDLADSRRLSDSQVEAEVARLTQAVERARAELRQALVELEQLGERVAQDMVEVELV